ncbi:dynein axonemal intermediate chain 4 [Cochliomyia hominivorax]
MFTILKRNVTSLYPPGFGFDPDSATLENNGQTIIIKYEYANVKASITGGPYRSDRYIFEFIYFNWLKQDHITADESTVELHLVFYNRKYGSYENASNINFGISVWSYRLVKFGVFEQLLSFDNVSLTSQFLEYLPPPGPVYENIYGFVKDANNLELPPFESFKKTSDDESETKNFAVGIYENISILVKSQESNNSINLEELMIQQRKGLGSIKASLDDVENGIKLSKLTLDVKPDARTQLSSDKRKVASRPNPFIKIKLTKTANIILYEQRSTTVLKDTEEGRLVEEDNKRYEYLTRGAGRKRLCFSMETQTNQELTKTRGVNTDSIARINKSSYVSNFEMFDTYKDLEKTTKSLDVNGTQKIEVTTYKVGGVDQFVDMNQSPKFKLALMLTMRILAGNTFETEQRRFRNMILPDPLALEVKYCYTLKHLWSYVASFSVSESSSIADMSWCPKNGDILAVGYGTFNTMCGVLPKTGSVYIWNIKNPVNAERMYTFQAPVVTVEFSPFTPQLLAIGLYDGSVYVYDISNLENPEICISPRLSTTSCEPITAIKWIAHSVNETKLHDLEPFLALSRDGIVTRYTIVNSPKLLGFQQMKLDRVEGKVEGLEIEEKLPLMEANRHPQGIYICLDPLHKDIYYVLTDEGCMHKCSTNYPNQHLEVLQLHEAGVNYMEFSPWSPKLYLTCGNDWCIRIWLLGIQKPLITLNYHMSPVHAASWSTTHSTIITALHRNSFDVWDLKRSILKPASSTKITTNSYYTTFKLSLCGRSVAVGNNEGIVEMLAFEDMPFPPHFQYDHLEKTLYKILANEIELLRDVKSLGYFGY